MRTHPLRNVLLGSLACALLAPAALAAPSLTVDADANRTVECLVHPQDFGYAVQGVTAQVHDDCSATAGADANALDVDCPAVGTDDVLPAFNGLSASTDGDCDAHAAVSV